MKKELVRIRYWAEGAGAMLTKVFGGIDSIKYRDKWPVGYLVDFEDYGGSDLMPNITIIVMDDAHIDDTRIEYRGNTYSGKDGIQKLAVVLEREKIEKMLGEL